MLAVHIIFNLILTDFIHYDNAKSCGMLYSPGKLFIGNKGERLLSVYFLYR